jgi:hypothetical protein
VGILQGVHGHSQSPIRDAIAVHRPAAPLPANDAAQLYDADVREIQLEYDRLRAGH